MSTCYLIGIGMGNPETLTLGAARRIAGCGLLIGAKRMLEAFPDHPGRKLALIRAGDSASTVGAFDGDCAVEYTHKQAMNALFGIAATERLALPAAVNTWLPLPLFVPEVDND